MIELYGTRMIELWHKDGRTIGQGWKNNRTRMEEISDKDGTRIGEMKMIGLLLSNFIAVNLAVPRSLLIKKVNTFWCLENYVILLEIRT